MGSAHRTLFGLTAVCLAAFAGCRSSKGKPADASAAVPLDRPEFVMAPFRIQSYGENAALEWQLTAPEAKAYTTMNLMRANSVDMTLFQNGQKSTSIQSDRGVFCIQPTGVSSEPEIPVDPNEPAADPLVEQGITLKSGDMFLTGNVVVTSTDGTKLMTEWMHYQKKEDVITSTAPVQVIRTDSITKGVGLQATPDLKRVKIFNETLVIKGTDDK